MVENVGNNKLNSDWRGPILFAAPSSIDEALEWRNDDGSWFGMFLAIDGRRVTDEDMSRLADRMLHQGVVYFHIAGADIARLRACLVERIVERMPNETEYDLIMTLDYRRTTVDWALWQFLWLAFPAQKYEGSVSFELVMCVGMPRQARRIRTMLDNQSELRHRQLKFTRE